MPDHLFGYVVLQLALILLTAFFTYAESAVSSSNTARLETEKNNGNKKAEKILRLTESRKVLHSARFAAMFFGLAAAAFTAGNGHTVQKLTDSFMKSYGIGAEYHTPVHRAVLILSLLVLAIVHYTFGIMIPAAAGEKRGEKAAMRLCGLIGFFDILLSPVTKLMMLVSSGITGALGLSPDKNGDEVTEEEIRQLVDESEESGNIESNEKQMIENIFEFNNITAADIMIHRTEMTAIDVAEPCGNILKLIEETGYSRFPVFEENIDNVIGILSTRVFLMNRCAENPKGIRDILYEPNFVPESVRADALFRDMQAKKLHMAVVLDEYGGTSGLVTMEDLLEEIVGNIYDETDEPSDDAEIRKLGDNLFRIDGTTELEKIEELFDINFSEEDDELSTLSGLIFSRFVTIPADGETPELDIDRLHIRVEKITEHRVDTALVNLLPAGGGDAGTADDPPG